MNLGSAEGARGNTLTPAQMNLSQLLQEGNKNTRKIWEALCCASNIDNLPTLYQVTDCNGDPIGSPAWVMPTIQLGNSSVRLCNYQQLADAINLGDTVPYDIPTIEMATTNWNLSDNNDISKVHSISISVIVSSGHDPANTDVVQLSIDGATAVTCGVGYTYNATATTVFNKDFTLSGFAGHANAIITTTQSA